MAPQYVGLENIESWTGKLIPATEDSAVEGQVKSFKYGDVLFGRLRPYLAKVFRARAEGVCTGELFVFEPKGVSQDFLFYYLLCRNVIATVDSSTYGAKMPRVGWDFMGRIPVVIPPEDEQKRITAFLDYRLSELDTLIAKKSRQIELLLEKREALISRASTGGLDPSESIVDSRVEWLGQIPSNWSVKRSKHILGEIDERSTAGEEELLTVSHITGVTPRSEKSVNMFMAETLEGYKRCKPGDLVINTMWAWAGAVGTSYQEGVVSPSYNVYRFKSPSSYPPYYDRLFRTQRFREEMKRHSRGVWESRLRLYPEEFFQIRVPIPPRREQEAIVKYLDGKLSVLDRVIARIRESISGLKEYRSALVDEVSTGQIDVRKEA